MVVAVDRIPPARRRRWGVLIPIVLAIMAPNLIGLLNGPAGSVTIDLIVYGAIFGLVLAAVFLWMVFAPGRRLYRALLDANPDLMVVPIHSAKDLVSGLEELNGARLASSELSFGAFLVFVDAGRQFELWRSHRGRPERVIRLPWASIDSIEIGMTTHLTMNDRALFLNVKSGERIVRIPISPQACHAVITTPVKDEAFTDFLTHLESRVARSRVGAEPRVADSGGKSGSETT